MFFVEIARLFIVLLATAAGFAIGRGGSPEAGNSAVVGAILGALIGYVAGGAFGRQLRRVMGVVEDRVVERPAPVVLAGVVGAACAGFLALLLGLPFVVLLPGRWGWPVLGLIVWIGVYEGFVIAARKSEGLLALAGLSSRPLVRASPYMAAEPDALHTLVDTSAIIDGRLLGIVRSGVVRGALLVPQFVLDELQGIADAQDPVRSRRGKRGLDVLASLQNTPGVEVVVLDDEVPEIGEVDAKLVALGKRLRAGLMTVDGNLQRVAELQGIRTLNVHALADSLRPVLLPGEHVQLEIRKEGREPGQGVGFLDDGTMVVVGDAAELIGREVEVRIGSSVKTSMGRILFGTLAGSTASPGL